jgi:hypothetical protein
MNTTLLLEIIRDMYPAIAKADQLTREAATAAEKARSETLAVVQSALTRPSVCPFMGKETKWVAAIVVPLLFDRSGKLYKESNLGPILSWLDYTLHQSDLSALGTERTPFCLIETQPVAGSAMRGGPLCGQSFNRPDTRTCITVGYLQSMAIEQNSGQIAVTLHSCRHISAETTPKNLTACISNTPVGEILTGQVTVANPAHLPYALCGPQLAKHLLAHPGLQVESQLFVGQQLADLLSTKRCEYEPMINYMIGQLPSQ